MFENKTAEAAAELKLLETTGMWCGMVDNWPVSLQQNRLSVPVGGKPDKEQLKALKALTKEAGGSAGFSGDTMVFSSVKKLPNGIADFVKTCVGHLTELEIPAPDTCPYCRQPGCDTGAFTIRGYRLCHYSCLRNKIEETKEKAEKNDSDGNYALGILGAFLGMLVGTLPSVFTILLMEREYAILFALIPICAFYGYKLFGGKLNKFALVLSIIAAILGVYILLFTVNGIWIGEEEFGMNAFQSLVLVPYLMADLACWADLTVGSITEFFFAVLGVLIGWRVISQTSAGSVAAAESRLENAVPWSRNGTVPAVEVPEPESEAEDPV